MDSQDTICSPILSVEELESFKIPPWVNSILPLQSKHNWCISTNNIRCHEDIQKWKVEARYLNNTVPRTIVCHDMKGGYLEDRFIHGSRDESSYNFIHWMVIDAFIYFSHSFITIPPFGWINAAHRHGVYILGTIITEGKTGEELLNSIIDHDDKINKFVNSIVNLTECFKLDGWLLNIENQVKNVKGLKKLVQQLSNDLHKQNPRNLVIWYDSVLETGELHWQNELNEKNSCWFDMCDGIFLNYNWKEKHLLNTYTNSGSRTLDVYVGIDVFARNCLGGMDTHKSMKIIREHGFSAAIFAPGWTHETLANEPNDTFRKRFEENDLKFWKSLSPYLYEHGTKNFFKTTFHSGCSKNYYNMNSLDLKMNSLRLGIDDINNVISDNDQNEKEDNKNLDNCNCQKIVTTNMLPNGTGLKICYQKPNQINRIVTCDITFNNTLLVACIYQYVQNPLKFNIVLLCQNVNGRLFRRELMSQSDDVIESNSTHCLLSQFEKLILLRRIFQLHTPLNDKWTLKCFKITNHEAKIMELGVELNEPGEILIGGFAICTYPIRGGMQ